MRNLIAIVALFLLTSCAHHETGLICELETLTQYQVAEVTQ